MSISESLRKIFIGSIPETVQESEIRAAASRYGTIQTFHYNQAHRGWALVTYDTPDEANAAVAGMHDRPIFSTCTLPIVCRIANEKKSAGGGGKLAMTTGANAYAMYGYGTAATTTGKQQGYYSASAMPDQPPQPMQWLTYYTPEGHPYYYNILTKTTQWEKPPELAAMMSMRSNTGTAMGVGMTQAQLLAFQQQQRMMMISPAEQAAMNEACGAKKFGPPGCNLFVFHIPSEWSHRDLYEHFKFHGKIVSARVKTGTEDGGRNLGFGFVSFETPESAFSAIKAMHGFNVGGKWLKVTLKKGEEHLLPLSLQSIYREKASGKISGKSSVESHIQTQNGSCENDTVASSANGINTADR